VRADIAALVPRIAARPFTPADLRALVDGLVADGLNGQYRDYAGAEQATMAIASLLDYLARRGALSSVRDVNASLDTVYDAVKDDETYKPERFQSALAQLAVRLKPAR
jgi:hypothetical protein